MHRAGREKPPFMVARGNEPLSRPVLRPEIRGKFIYVGGEKLYVRGATYGTFRPNAAGEEYPEPENVELDFAAMADNGLNAVRTYTVPPPWLLDAARRHQLRVMVGLPWEQHVAFLDDRRTPRSIEERVRGGVRACSGHPAVLCYAIGNEIPTSIVRWHGRERIEQFLERLYHAAKDEDPDGLVTYVNFPSTEYLQLPFLDFATFNVYLELLERFERYLARLHNLTGDRPLVMAEVGLDSRRNGHDAQAAALSEQLGAVFRDGCAGAFVFSWTDEWHRGGFDIDDWDFGLVDRERRPKPALAAARRAFASVPFGKGEAMPPVSVVVCCYNSAGTLPECLAGIQALDYPNFETIVVDDGSTDETADIARRYGVRTISIANHGLATARNVGLHVADGEIVAYIDGDATPDPHWLQYLAAAFRNSSHVGIGGPNIPPPDGPIADCVSNAPGGAIHVLLTDTEAEHIPGCNMAFRREALEAIGGFDPQFRAAGDDVDICWRLQAQGWTLGFSPAAVVWHRRRDFVRGYWHQQLGYGKAEALLERKWPEKYNATGHVTWGGRIYGNGLASFLFGRRWRIYYGTGASGLFQPAEPVPSRLGILPLMPEWWALISLLAGISVLGLLWRPLLLALPLLALAVVAVLVQASRGAVHASFDPRRRSRGKRLLLHALTAGLYVVQPVARLWGRVSYGLTPWRRGRTSFAIPVPRTVSVWSETWHDAKARLSAVEGALRQSGNPARRGGPFARWDLEVSGGVFGSARLRMGIEEHGAGRQLVRFRVWPRPSRAGCLAVLLLAGSAVGAATDGADEAVAILAAAAVLAGARLVQELASTTAIILRALELQPGSESLERHLLGRARSAAAGERAEEDPELRIDRPVPVID
jgi:GT2 family glycosyltransferase